MKHRAVSLRQLSFLSVNASACVVLRPRDTNPGQVSAAHRVQTGCVRPCVRKFKVAALTCKVLHGCAPSYLGPFVRVADLPSRRALRSANTSRLIQPQSNRSTVGYRAFPVAGPQVWNSLPPEVTSAPSLDTFRRRLKTHLFTFTVSYSNIQLS